MASDEKIENGIAAAVDQVMSETPKKAFGWSGDQLSLLPTLPMMPKAQKGGLGRPPGSGNKSTLEWAKYINARYTNPLIFLSETVNRPVDQLAIELDCSPLEAFKVQQAAAAKLLEYTNQKMPTTLELGNDGDMILQINTVYHDPNPAPGDDAKPVDQGGPVVINMPEIDNKSD